MATEQGFVEHIQTQSGLGSDPSYRRMFGKHAIYLQGDEIEGSDHLRKLSLMKARLFALGAIRIYQRYISPYKGFSCAYRQHTGRASCSAFGYRAVRRHGVVAGLGLVRERTQRCGDVQRRLASRRFGRPSAQGGFCDGCDVASCDTPGCDDCNACDLLGGCDGPGCDFWSERRRRQKDDERPRERIQTRSRVDPDGLLAKP